MIVALNYRVPLAAALLTLLVPAAALAQVVADPTSLTFGPAIVGTEESKSFQLINQGKVAVALGKVELAGGEPNNFRLSEPMGTIAPGASKVVTVGYQALVAGAHSASVVVGIPGQTNIRVTLSGSALVPSVQVANGQSELDFGEVAIGRSSAAIAVGLRNPPSGVPIAIGAIHSATTDFVVDTSKTQISLAPGDTTTFELRFAPKISGPTSGTVDVVVVFGKGPAATIRVWGNGVAAASSVDMAGMTEQNGPSGGCRVSSRSASLDPGAIAVLGLALLLRRRARLRRGAGGA